MFEKDLPGNNSTGWGTPADQIGTVPLEVCETINGSWGFNLQDRKHKSEKELIHYLIKASGYGSNMLLNVGPMPNGKIQPKHQYSLRAIGDWLKQNGQTIYGTRKGPIPPNDDYVSTQKGKTVYLHLLNPRIDIIHANKVPVKIKGIYDLKTNSKLPFKNDNFGLAIDASKISKDDVDTIIKIELR
jgi:alpha-L-fucosidase